MKSKGKPKQPGKQKDAPNAGKSRWLLLAAVIVGAIAGVLFWGTKNTSHVENTTSTQDVPALASAEKDQLVGRWVRTDSNGGYTLEIRSALADGKLDAGYFNPNPINVSRAEWQKKEGGLLVVVELRDVNYPGSTYTLNFSKEDDRMTGTYYQAVEGVNFDVAFARVR